MPVKNAARVGLGALAGVLLVACGGDGEGTTGESVAGSLRNGVMLVPVSIDGTTAQLFIVDTGSALTRIDPNRYASLGLATGLTRVMTLDVGSVHVTDVDVFAAGFCGTMMVCAGLEPAGLLGGQVLMDRPFTIDYRARTVTFGDFTPPSGVGAPVVTPFALEGGGSATVGGTPIVLPATRISVEVEIEGTTRPMVVDTGSSTLVLRPDVYDALVADGRTQSSVDLGTVMGTSSVPTTHVHTVVLGGTTQSEVEALRSPLDIGALEKEVGHPVDGLLGGAYLENYVTTVDYPAHTITLRAYAR